ncbi:MAG TPA: glutamate 5-kinase [Tepidisphaeraceae bacterium]|nr:glutamate 5-kinase [Tepidisphaeraceae bacterium]
MQRKNLAAVSSVVVKLGSQLLTGAGALLDEKFLADIARQVAELRAKKLTVTLVSSGAIASGLRELNLDQRPADLAMLQAVAAVGQRRLMDHWANAFAPYQFPVAQILVTRHDIDQRQRFLNLRNTLLAIHQLNAVPIINENDTVSTDELVRITFGDNDILAASVAHALRADLLVLLTIVDGLLDPAGQPVRLVHSIDEARQLIRHEKSAAGKGGMDSKLLAAKMVTDAGEAMIVAGGRTENVLPRILAGEEIGTLFVPASDHKRPSRDRWIGAIQPAGKIVIDDGACRAVAENHKSLLAAGVVDVEGDFSAGAAVAIVSHSGKTIARGLSNYSADDVRRIAGKKSAEVRKLLAEAAYDEVVHRDNLVLD